MPHLGNALTSAAKRGYHNGVFRQYSFGDRKVIDQALSYNQLREYTELNNRLEQSLGLNSFTRTLPDELKEALEQVILPQVAASDNPLYATLWTIIDKEPKLMVGDLCFKGAPNAQGEVEIGYGTYDSFQGRGFMTEAIGAVTQWALKQPEVQAILAETDINNIASHRTLSKNSFTVYKEVENMIWWRLNRADCSRQKRDAANSGLPQCKRKKMGSTLQLCASSVN
jgi:RimJ/RimL family protein N-acetyltransferase